MGFLHVVLDNYDYQEILRVSKKEILDEHWIFLDLHMELGICDNLPLHFDILQFVEDYDGLNFGCGSDRFEEEMQKIERIKREAANGTQIILWHRNTAESLSALFFMVSILKGIAPRGKMREGVNLDRQVKRLIYSKGLIDDTEELRLVNESSKEIIKEKEHWMDLVFSALQNENEDLRIIFSPYQKPISTRYTYFDNFILSYFKRRPVNPEVVIKALQHDIGGEQYLWKCFIIYRLCQLRDYGYFDVISTPHEFDMARPTIFGERWRVRQEIKPHCDVFDYDELGELLKKEETDVDAENELNYLLHNIPISFRSKDFLFDCIARQISDIHSLIVCLLVRFSEIITEEERKNLIKMYSHDM